MTALALDHVIVGGRDLEALAAWFEAASGIAPTKGGVHEGLGTCNAIVSFGLDTYLELLAIDPGQSVASAMTRRLAALTEPTAMGWAVHGGAAGEMAASLRAAALAVSERSMRRVPPDGGELAWDLVFVDQALGPVIPFLIDWKDAASPAASAASGAALERMTLLHPDPAAAQTVIDKLGLDFTVERGEKSGPRLRLATPKGPLEVAP